MKRRSFVNLSAMAALGIILPGSSCKKNHESHEFLNLEDLSAFQNQSFNLLKIWCDAMIHHQINDKSNPIEHGALYCHACQVVHGRCLDAVYPFMYMADVTGEEKYLNAAIKVIDWSVNVDLPDGSWTNMIDPKSWTGTTVFGRAKQPTTATRN